MVCRLSPYIGKLPVINNARSDLKISRFKRAYPTRHAMISIDGFIIFTRNLLFFKTRNIELCLNFVCHAPFRFIYGRFDDMLNFIAAELPLAAQQGQQRDSDFVGA